MVFKRIDEKYVEGKHLNFEDKGYVSPGSKTRRFAVISRFNQALIGYVKYHVHIREYIYFPLNSFLKADGLREVAEFCDEVTISHRTKRQAFPASAQKQVVEAVT